MVLLRALTRQCLRLNLLINASHFSGSSNQLADSLSCFDLQKFHSSAPEASLVPDNSSRPSLGHFQAGVKKLLTASLSGNSQLVYKNALKIFEHVSH